MSHSESHFPSRRREIPEARLSARLQLETRSAHVALERLPLSRQLFARRFAAEALISYLSRVLGFYRPMEARLFPLLAEAVPAGDWAARQKTPLLESDLVALGLDLEAVSQLPDCTDLPALEAPPQGLGVFYVFEGAALGGQFLRREMARYQSWIPAYFQPYLTDSGDETHNRWAETCAMVDTVETAESDSVVAAALQTYAALESWLAEAEIQ